MYHFEPKQHHHHNPIFVHFQTNLNTKHQVTTHIISDAIKKMAKKIVNLFVKRFILMQGNC